MLENLFTIHKSSQEFDTRNNNNHQQIYSII